jgi:hypothetical protein
VLLADVLGDLLAGGDWYPLALALVPLAAFHAERQLVVEVLPGLD